MGPGKKGESQIPPILVQKMTQYFDDLNIFLEEEVLCVADVIVNYLELYNTIDELKKYINIENEEIKIIKECYLSLKQGRKAADILSEEEKEKMKKDLNLAYASITKQLNN